MKRITEHIEEKEEEEEETTASRLWKKLGSDSVYALYSSFFLSLAAGDPDSLNFFHFVSQDIILLESIARACELIKGFADDDDEKKAIQEVRDSTDLKIQTQNLFLQDCGLKLPKESNNPDPETTKLTEFLLFTASGTVEGQQVPCKIVTPFERTKVSAYTMSVIASLSRLYDHVFHTANTFLDPLRCSLLCKKWTHHYNSQDFKVASKKIEAALERLSVALTGGELGLVERLYKKGLSLGIDFFNGQRVSQLPLVPLTRAKDVAKAKLIVFCDFDLTCTSVDSSALLAEMAIATVQGKFTEASQILIESQDIRRKWNLVSNRYAEEFEKCVTDIDTCWPGGNYDYEGLSSALKEVSDFEKRANERVVESGVLKGISERNIKLAGKGLVLRDGCKNFFRKIVKNDVSNSNVTVHIISYCWCSDLITEALSSELSSLKVYANDLAYKESVTTGEIVRKVESPEEKLECFFKVVRENDGDREKYLTVFVGGDVGDFLCLLEAEIGIVTGSSKSLEKLGRRFGVEFVPLLHGLVKKSKEISLDSIDTWRSRSGTLYTVSSWAEIEAFILGF